MASRSIPPASPPPEPGPGAGPGAGPGPGPTGLSVVVASRLLIVGLLGFGLVYLQSILIPLVFALLLSFVLLPAVRWLTRRKVPSGVAIMACLTAAMLPLTGLILFFISTAGPLSQEMPKYQDRLVYETNHLIDWAATRIGDDEARETVRRELTENLLPRILDEGARMAQRTLGTATAVLGAFALTLLLAGFCLAEAQRFREKFAEAYGGDHPLLDALKGIGHDVRAYLVAKTFISAVTGLCVGLFLWACGVDFAAFWGLLAFPLNFIPTVGAVVASLPPVLVALVDPALSGWMAFSVVVGLVAINGVIGAWLDPRYVGHAVKVSPLVVFGSMLVWGILWGPVGMILAVPIMVSVKVICARFPGLERIATLMKG